MKQIYLIFNKILEKIKSEKGAVEFIESAIVYPIIVIFISIILLFTINIIKKSIKFEHVYKNSREILNYTNNDLRIINRIDKEKLNKIQNKQNLMLNNLKEEELHINTIEGIIYAKVINKNDKQENYLETSKTDVVDITRKIDFVHFVLNDLKENKLFSYTLDNIYKNIEDIAERFVQKIK